MRILHLADVHLGGPFVRVGRRQGVLALAQAPHEQLRRRRGHA